MARMSIPPHDPAERKINPIPTPQTIPANTAARIGFSMAKGAGVMNRAAMKKAMMPKAV